MASRVKCFPSKCCCFTSATAPPTNVEILWARLANHQKDVRGFVQGNNELPRPNISTVGRMPMSHTDNIFPRPFQKRFRDRYPARCQDVTSGYERLLSYPCISRTSTQYYCRVEHVITIKTCITAYFHVAHAGQMESKCSSREEKRERKCGDDKDCDVWGDSEKETESDEEVGEMGEFPHCS